MDGEHYVSATSTKESLSRKQANIMEFPCRDMPHEIFLAAARLGRRWEW